MNLKLKARIVEQFGSQADFAQTLEIDEPFVSRIVRGRRVLSERDQKRWAKKLRCSVEELFPVDSVQDE